MVDFERRRLLRDAATFGSAIPAAGCITDSGESVERIPYIGISGHRGIEGAPGGPAVPDPAPQLPLRIDDGGNLVGRVPQPNHERDRDPTMAIAGFEYSMQWYQYCTLQGYVQIDPRWGLYGRTKVDNTLRYMRTEEIDWYEGSPGWPDGMIYDKVNVDDFDDWRDYRHPEPGAEESGSEASLGVGKPAYVQWRSSGFSYTFPVGLMKTDQETLLGNADSDAMREWIEETCPEGFVAWISVCTSDCCNGPFSFRYDEEAYDGSQLPVACVCPCGGEAYTPLNLAQAEMVVNRRPEWGPRYFYDTSGSGDDEQR